MDDPTVVSGQAGQVAGTTAGPSTTDNAIPAIPGGFVVMTPGNRKLMCKRCRQSFSREHIKPGTTDPTEEGKRRGLYKEQGALLHNCQQGRKAK